MSRSMHGSRAHNRENMIDDQQFCRCRQQANTSLIVHLQRWSRRGLRRGMCNWFHSLLTLGIVSQAPAARAREIRARGAPSNDRMSRAAYTLSSSQAMMHQVLYILDGLIKMPNDSKIPVQERNPSPILKHHPVGNAAEDANFCYLVYGSNLAINFRILATSLCSDWILSKFALFFASFRRSKPTFHSAFGLSGCTRV